MSDYSGSEGHVLYMDKMKILIEDKFTEDAVMDGEMCISVPFEITILSSGEKYVRCLSCFKGVADEFVKKFGNDPFSRDAKDFVRAELFDKMNSIGYETDADERGHLVYYSADETFVPTADTAAIETVMLSVTSEFDNYKIPDSMFAELDDGDELDVCFAVVLDDRIVSYAAINDMSEDGSLEINVETEPEYRGKGFGSAVVSALVNYLVSKGEKVSYCSEKNNASSISVAQKIGLRFEKESYSFVYYLNE